MKCESCSRRATIVLRRQDGEYLGALCDEHKQQVHDLARRLNVEVIITKAIQFTKGSFK